MFKPLCINSNFLIVIRFYGINKSRRLFELTLYDGRVGQECTKRAGSFWRSHVIFNPGFNNAILDVVYYIIAIRVNVKYNNIITFNPTKKINKERNKIPKREFSSKSSSFRSSIRDDYDINSRRNSLNFLQSNIINS